MKIYKTIIFQALMLFEAYVWTLRRKGEAFGNNDTVEAAQWCGTKWLPSSIILEKDKSETQNIMFIGISNIEVENVINFLQPFDSHKL